MYSSPGTPDRHRPQRRVQHVDLRVRDRPADRHRAVGSPAAGPASRHVDGRLGRAVQVVQSAPRQRALQRSAQRGRQRLAAADHPPQRPGSARGAGSARKACSIDGTKCTRRDAARRGSAAPGTRGRGARPASPTTSRAPTAAARRTPRPRRRSWTGSSAARGRRRSARSASCIQSQPVARCPRWVTTTPLGRPVEPEV